MESFQFNLKSHFKYQNKFFFEKSYFLLEQYKDKQDVIYFDEKLHGEGYVCLKKEQKKYMINLVCDNNTWIVETNFDNNLKKIIFDYSDDDYTIIQIHKELIKYLNEGE